MSGLDRTLASLAAAAAERPVAALIRHAERPEPSGIPGEELELTARGGDESHALGRRLGARVRRIAHSPVLRCRQTAEAILLGSGSSAAILPDRRLGGPGLFVEDEREAGQTFATLGIAAVLAGLVAGRQLPGLAHPARASAAMVEHLLAICDDQPPGLYLFITHDSLLAPTLGWLFGGASELPDYLDALSIWRDDEITHARHRTMITSR
jgi:broad specificity phosphatase PhoE